MVDSCTGSRFMRQRQQGIASGVSSQVNDNVDFCIADGLGLLFGRFAADFDKAIRMALYPGRHIVFRRVSIEGHHLNCCRSRPASKPSAKYITAWLRKSGEIKPMRKRRQGLRSFSSNCGHSSARDVRSFR